jgi:hypothetical protein
VFIPQRCSDIVNKNIDTAAATACFYMLTNITKWSLPVNTRAEVLAPPKSLYKKAVEINTSIMCCHSVCLPRSLSYYFHTIYLFLFQFSPSPSLYLIILILPSLASIFQPNSFFKERSAGVCFNI